MTLGPDGVMLEAVKRWANIQRSDVYQLRSANEAWQQVQSNQAYIEAEIPEDEAPAGTTIVGSVTFNNVSIAYTTSGPAGGDQYLQPIFVFRGRIRLERERHENACNSSLCSGLVERRRTGRITNDDQRNATPQADDSAGQRTEPEYARRSGTYGRTTLAEIEARLGDLALAGTPPATLIAFQSNYEGAIVEALHGDGRRRRGSSLTPERSRTTASPCVMRWRCARARSWRFI
ncbi:MAG: hypothetical protein R2845_09425 [Thermomicrobiales bacterium]